MKITTLLLIWALGIMPIFCQAQVTVQVIENKNKQEELPLYNLYYISKYICSGDLSPEKRKELYSNLISQIDVKKLKDSKNFHIGELVTEQENSLELLKKRIKILLKKGEFSEIENNLNFSERRQIYLDVLKDKYQQKEDLKKELVSNKVFSQKDILTNIQKYCLPKNKEFKISDTTKIKDILRNLNKKTDEDEFIFSLKDIPNITLDSTKNICNLKPDIEKKLRALDTEIINYEKNEKEYLEIVDKSVKNLKIISSETAYNLANITDEKQTQSQININAIVQSSQKDLLYSGLSLPSESQMIEAMAIFLANRAKQEAAIWFMDQVRNRMSNPLVYEAFPETLKLVDNLEDYRTPNFGTAWRYAISSDFVKMPKNIVSSGWIQEKVFNNDIRGENLKTSLDFGYNINRMISERYNYRDIIRYFYINSYLPDNGNEFKEGSIKPLLNNSFSGLYIITNELFTIEKINNANHYRLLSYEEIANISEDQYKTLLELIKLKYGNKFSFSGAEDLQKRESINKWLGNLLISLNQFDKINDEQKSLREQNKLDSTDQSFYTVWKILNQVIANIASNNEVSKKYENEISFLQNSTVIYEFLQQKNFIAAAQKTISIIDTYTNDFVKKEINFSNILLNGNMQIQKLNNQMYIIETIKDGKHYKNGSMVINNTEVRLCDKEDNEILLIKDFDKIKPFINYLNKKNDTYDMVLEVLNSNDGLFQNNISKFAKKINLSEIQLIHLINYTILLNSVKNPNQIDLKTVLKSFSNYSIVKPEMIDQSYNSILKKYNGKYTSQLLSLTSFFGDVITAKDEKELANVIDSHALPPTSYKLKRRVASSVDINSYVGGYAGVLAPSKGSSIENKVTGGLTATVGISFTGSKRNAFFTNSGIAVDILDLGNLVNHYLITDTDYDKDVHFSEVFSPGLHFITSIGNTPLVFSAGVKFLPLKAVRLDNNEVINGKFFDATIFNVGLKIDIPLVNLYSKDFSK